MSLEMINVTSSLSSDLSSLTELIKEKTKTEMNYYRQIEQINKWLFILIYEKNGKLVSEITSSASGNMHMYELCNITQYASNTLKEQITLVPLYTEFGKSFVKNTYINYERMFQPGLKFIDQNKNEFVTLGSYLLYYNGKHK